MRSPVTCSSTPTGTASTPAGSRSLVTVPAGTSAAVVASLARTDGIPLAHQLLICPNTDTRFDTPSFHAFGDGYGLTADGMIWFFKRYCGGADPDDPRLAPLRAPHFRGLAPATVITAEYDILRDEGEAYGAALAAAGCRSRCGVSTG